MGCGIRNQALIHLQNERQATGGATKSSSENVSNIRGPGKASGGQEVSKMRPTDIYVGRKTCQLRRKRWVALDKVPWISNLFQTNSGVSCNYVPNRYVAFSETVVVIFSMCFLLDHSNSLTSFEVTHLFKEFLVKRWYIYKHIPGNYSRKTSFARYSLLPRMTGFLWVILCSTRPFSISWRLIP